MYTNVAKNRRLANRYPLFRGDYPTLILCRPGEKDLLETELVDRSCDGLGLFAHSSYNLSEGDQVELFIASSPEKKFRAVIKRISASTHPARQGYRIGVYFQFNEDKQPRYPRLYLRHKIQNVLAQDLFDEDQSHIYSISDVSLTGLTLETHNPESILIPQQTTTLTIILLDAKSFQVPVTVKNLRQGSDQAIQLGCSFNKLDFYFLARLAQYISVKDSQNNTVKMIREAGFYIDPMLSHAYRIRYVSSRNDWEQLLQLRLLAQQTEGRMQSVTDYTLCADQHDSTSRHLMVFCGEQLVGTGRMVFNYGVVERAEHANLCPIPDFIVQAGFTENSRAATHPAFRRTMIFQYLIRYYYRIAIQENLAYMIINCEDSLVKIYQRFGGRPTGDTFYTEYMEDRRLNLIYFDVKEIASGHQLPFKIWSFIFHDKLSILKEKNIRVRSKYRILQKILNLSKKVLEYVSHLQLHKNSRLAYEKQRQKIQQGE